MANNFDINNYLKDFLNDVSDFDINNMIDLQKFDIEHKDK